jgi:hypothetical protein
MGSKVRFFGGVMGLLLEGSIKALSGFQDLDWLRTNFLPTYIFITSPGFQIILIMVSLGFVGWGCVEMWKQRKPSRKSDSDTDECTQTTHGDSSPIFNRIGGRARIILNMPGPSKDLLGHPDLILERSGDMLSGALRLYNRGSAEAFNITLSRIAIKHARAMVEWSLPSTRLAPKDLIEVSYRLVKSSEVNMNALSVETSPIGIGLLLSELVCLEDRISKPDPLASTFTLIRYRDLTKTKWFTRCNLNYHWNSGELKIEVEDPKIEDTRQLSKWGWR